MTKRALNIVYFSDVMCVWAYAAQVRLDELLTQFGDDIRVSHRFCSVYGDVESRIQAHAGDQPNPRMAYAEKMRGVAAQFDHTRMHTDIFSKVVPRSCNQAQLVLCGVRSALASEELEDSSGLLLSQLIRDVRLAFFEQARDIGQLDTVFSILEQASVPRGPVEATLADGRAMAELSGDLLLVNKQQISGSPTYVLDGGREKLFGNVGYRIIEANVRELLERDEPRGASWC